MSSVTRWKWVTLAVLCWLAVGWLAAPDVRGQKDEKPEKGEKVKPEPGTTATPLYYGVAACNNKGCHGGEPPRVWLKGKELLCRCVEASVWEAKDKHDQAYNALTEERGQRMGKVLGYDVTKAKACLTCHAVWIGDEKLREASEEVQFKIEEGVNCVVCHGAYSEWVSAHSTLVTAGKFRPQSREEKWAKAGMKDLWDPLKRAELCASCHVGNRAEDRFVTHEMYAAGHPPLPSFEVATFSNEMPRHWQYLREKSEALQKELKHTPGELEETKLLLVGAAVALRENMKLLQADAASDEVKKGDSLDLAHFDCYACHHDLKGDSWRLKRGYDKGRKPGRVGMRPWSSELVKLAVTADGKSAGANEKEYATLLAALNAAFDARPYGDPAGVSKAAAALEAFADKLAKSLNRGEGGARAFKEEDARRLLAAIPKVHDPATRLYDYDTARQIVWTHELLRKELVRAVKKGEVKDDDPELKKIDEDLKGFEEKLRLRLPRKAEKGSALEAAYGNTLERIAAWNPFESRELFKGLTSDKP